MNVIRLIRPDLALTQQSLLNLPPDIYDAIVRSTPACNLM